MRGNTRAGCSGFLTEMSLTPRLRRRTGRAVPIAGLDEATVEALLATAPQLAGTRVGSESGCTGEPGYATALAEMVAAARRPGRPDELVGLPAAREAFAAVSWRSAQPAPRRRWLVRLAGVPAAVGLASTLALGGVAYAAYANALPSGWQAVAHALLGSLGVPGAPARRDSPSALPRSVPRAASSGLPAGYAAEREVAAWCQVAEQAATGSRALPEAIRRDLVAAAGGSPRILAFCAGHKVAPAPGSALSPASGATTSRQSAATATAGRPRPTTQPSLASASPRSGTPGSAAAARAQPSARATPASTAPPAKQPRSGPPGASATVTASPDRRPTAAGPAPPATARG